MPYPKTILTSLTFSSTGFQRCFWLLNLVQQKDDSCDHDKTYHIQAPTRRNRIRKLAASFEIDWISRHACHTVQRGVRYLKRVVGAP